MEKIKVKDKVFSPYIKYDELCRRFDDIASELNREYGSGTDVPIILCVLNGAMMFTSEIMKRLDFACELMSVKLKSYNGTHSTGVIQQIMGLSGDVSGRRVIIMEDIVDTGNTMVYLNDLLHDRGVKDIRICTMIFKDDAYKKDLPIDYVGFSIENKFIVGFGLDYDELGRNFRDIYILDE